MTNIVFGSPLLPVRFWEKVRCDDATGCWVWTASKNDAGYGFFWYRDERRYAHLVAWEALKVAQRRSQLDSRCFTRSCVYPNHFSLSERPIQVFRSDRSRCPWGHRYDGMRKSGVRRCLTCHRLAQRARSESRRLSLTLLSNQLNME